MTIAVVITLLASFLWATTSHIDKYLLCKIDSSTTSIKTLMVFSTFVAGLVLSPIWCIINKFQVQISIYALLIAFLSAMVYVIATYLYFKALEKTDASIIAVMFQLIPVFSYILGLMFFNEILNLNQIIGGIIIIFASIIISIDFNDRFNKSKTLALVLMLMSSFFSALYYILFEISMKNSSYNSTVFWYQIGLLLIGIGLLVLKPYRQDFFLMMKVNGKKFISINVANEGLNLMAHFMLNFANLTLPIALANIVSNGFNGAFVFVIGAIGVLLFPKVFSEDLSKKVVIQKVGCIVLGIVGMTIMFL